MSEQVHSEAELFAQLEQALDLARVEGRKAIDEIAQLRAENERLKREKMLASGSGSMMTQNWAYVCGKLAAATGNEPHMETMPAGYQGTYCRGYDEQKGWAEGTTLKMVEG